MASGVGVGDYSSNADKNKTFLDEYQGKKDSDTATVKKLSGLNQTQLYGPMGVPTAAGQQLMQAQARLRSNQNQYNQIKAGKNADGSFVRPDFVSLVDPNTGLLNSNYTVNDKVTQFGVNEDAINKLRPDALRDAGTDSTWGAMMKEKLGGDQNRQLAGLRTTANNSQQASLDALAAQGGLSGGARERIARGTLRDTLRGSQGVNQDFNNQRQGISIQDEQNRVGQLKDLQSYNFEKANFDSGQQDRMLSGRESDVNRALAEVQNHRADNMDAWKKNQDVWAANKQADAQANAGGGGGGCCFIFLEARYGNGAMDDVVRKYRDEFMTDRNKRGYYKLSQVLVPLMRMSPAIKGAVRVLMTDPMVSYGKWHYERRGPGFLFAPVKNFWLKAFDYLGQDHEFIRESGEVV
jgi:hypothetical protein